MKALIKVRAIKMGFYEALRQVGDEFHVPDGLQASWFVAVDVPPEASGDEGNQDPPGKKGKKKPSPEEQPPA